MFFPDAALLAPKKITGQSFADLAEGTRRICFGSTHSNALRKSNSRGRYEYFLNLPFRETIGPLLARDLMISLKESDSGRFWAGFGDEDDADPLRTWINKRSDLIFIRDLLDLSVALAINYGDDERTELGELEYQAKFHESEASRDAIVDRLNSFIDANKLYQSADVIAAVPPRPNKGFDLPSELAQGLGGLRDLPVLTSGVWQNGKPSLKEIPLDQKWSVLDEGDLTFEKKDLEGKRVLLLDDLYQSGATMNYVAGRLRNFGAKRVFGLSVVKSRRDTDNS